MHGSWVAKGANADCSRPDFDVTANTNGMSVIETRIDGYSQTGAVDVGETPALQWDAPLPSLPIETRGPDGLAVLPPASGETVTLAGHDLSGGGVVFVKCTGWGGSLRERAAGLCAAERLTGCYDLCRDRSDALS